MGQVFLYIAVFFCSILSLTASQPATGSKKAAEPKFLGLGLLGALASEVTIIETWSPNGGKKPSSSGGNKPGKRGKPESGGKGGKKGVQRGDQHEDDDDDYTDYYDDGSALQHLFESWASLLITFVITFTCLVEITLTYPVGSTRNQSKFFWDILGWNGGHNHGGHHHHHHQRPGPLQLLILGYVAQQALQYYFGGDNGGGCGGKSC